MLNSYYIKGGNTTNNTTTNVDAVSGTITAASIDSFFFTCEIGSTMFNNLMGFNPHVVHKEKQSYTNNYGLKDCYYRNEDVPVKIVQSMILPNGHMMFEVVKAEDLKNSID